MYDVIIPWRADGGPREKIFGWVIERWGRLVPAANLIIIDSGSETFSRSESRNVGFEQSTSDIVVFADADTPPLPAFLNVAVKMATDGEWVLPYGKSGYYNLNQKTTDYYLNLAPASELYRPTAGQFDHQLMAWAGIVVVPRDAFKAVGGYDTRFVGWGHEDVAFRLALDNEWGKHLRVNDGYLLHLDHPRADATFDTDIEMKNRVLFDTEYRRKYGWNDERIYG